MPHCPCSPRALLREFVCDIVIFLYKVGEALLDATMRPYITVAVCHDLFDPRDWPATEPQPQRQPSQHQGYQQRLLSEGNGSHVLYKSLLLANGRSACSHLDSLPEIQAEVQRHAAGVLVAYRVLVNIPAIILGLFCGAWSDRKGRKLPMLAPSVGSCLAVLIYLPSLQVHGFKVALLLAGAVTQGLFGKTSVISMAVSSHVADTSSTEQRTRRLGRLLASNFLGMFLGSLLAGLLQDLSTLRTTLTVVSACHALCVLTIVLGVRETVPDSLDHDHDDVNFMLSGSSAGEEADEAKDSDGLLAKMKQMTLAKDAGDFEAKKKRKPSAKDSDDLQAKKKRKALAVLKMKKEGVIVEEDEEEGDEEEAGKAPEKKKAYTLFSLSGLKDSLSTVFKKRDGNKRCVILLSLLVLTVHQCLKVGDQDVTVLFAQQPPLSWPSSRFGYLIAADYGTMGLTLLLMLPLLADVLNVPDTSIVLLAVLFKLVRALWAGFCTETWMLFTSVVWGALGGLINPALRSVLSKTASPREVGKVFAIQASLETASKLIGSTLFTGIYAATVDVLPSAAYLAEVACYLLVLALVLYLGQSVREDSTFGLFMTFHKPYKAVDTCDKADVTPVASKGEVKVNDKDVTQTSPNLFPMGIGATTP